MRSFRQWLLPLLATASLLLLVAACGAWARSHVLRDEWRARDAPVVREWSSDSGRVAYVRYTVENDPHPEPDRSWQWRRSVPGSGLATRSGGGALTDAGFSFGDEYRLSFRGAGARTVGVKVRAYSVPYWLLAAGAAVMPLAWGRRGYRRHRRVAWAARGQCIACGYDLRGSRDRCAECGVPITENPTACLTHPADPGSAPARPGRSSEAGCPGAAPANQATSFAVFGQRVRRAGRSASFPRKGAGARCEPRSLAGPLACPLPGYREREDAGGDI